MSEPHCYPIEVDGQPVIACGGHLTEGDLEAIREFQQILRSRGRWREMANPRTSSSPETPAPGGGAAHPELSRDDGRAGPGCASNVSP